MNQKTFSRLLRYATLSNQMIDTAKENLHPNLKAIAPRMKAASEAFWAANTTVIAKDSAAKKEVAEAVQKLEAFGRNYDGLRGVITANAPQENTGSASSSYPTPIDLIEAAAQLAKVLNDHGQEPWAAERSATYAAELESARKEWTDALESQNQVQKLRTARRAAANELSDVLVEFRKVVKAVYGSNSREYHSIKADNYNSETEEEGADTTNPTTEPAPATPEAAQEAKSKTDKAA
jgi:hypothetical protein